MAAYWTQNSEQLGSGKNHPSRIAVQLCQNVVNPHVAVRAVLVRELFRVLVHGCVIRKEL